MNPRVIDHFTDQIIKVLHDIENADSMRLSLPEYKQKIEFIKNRSEAISRVNWQKGDELQKLLTEACLYETSL